jgi:hypothetical protein
MVAVRKKNIRILNRGLKMKKRKLVIACDFDGTIVTHKFPEIGEEIEGAIDTLKSWKEEGHRLILWTCREDTKQRNYLSEAIQYCKDRGLEFDAANDNLPESIKAYGINSRKITTDLFVDDLSVNPGIGWDLIKKSLK